IQSELDSQAVSRVTQELLADPVNQTAVTGATGVAENALLIEVHYQPGVMDPVAQSTQDAIAEMTGLQADQVEVRTGLRFDFSFDSKEAAANARESAKSFAQRFL